MLHLTGKLQEFNQSVGAERKVDEESLKSLEKVLAGQPTESSVATLQQILEWPAGLSLRLDLCAGFVDQMCHDSHFELYPFLLAAVTKTINIHGWLYMHAYLIVCSCSSVWFVLHKVFEVSAPFAMSSGPSPTSSMSSNIIQMHNME